MYYQTLNIINFEVLTCIFLSTSVTNLGAVFDRKCKMAEHANRICRNANYYLHRIQKIRDCLNFNNAKLLVHSLVTSRLDYANGLLHNAPVGVIKKLERVQRSSARVVCRLHKLISTDFYDRGTPRPLLAASRVRVKYS